jgi:hypothetical protein
MPDLQIGFMVGRLGRGAMPQTASLLALVGVLGFALLSLLFGIFT